MTRIFTPARLSVLMALAAFGLYAVAILGYIPPADLQASLLNPDTASFAQIYVHYSLMPRMLVALFAGAALAFAGTIFQQLLKIRSPNRRRLASFPARNWRSRC